MSQDAWAQAFNQITEGAKSLKEVALNRHDRDFDTWHRQARSVLLRYAPVKIPAFDEIRFASDFFLEKPGEEQMDINDRIALVSDIDLSLEIFDFAREQVTEELRLKKSRERIGGGTTLDVPPQPEPAAPIENGEKTVKESPASCGLEDLPALIEASDLTRREKAEALEEIDRVRQAFEKGHPDWDRIKRSVKFLLDFDKTLALKAVPIILKSYQHLTPR